MIVTMFLANNIIFLRCLEFHTCWEIDVFVVYKSTEENVLTSPTPFFKSSKDKRGEMHSCLHLVDALYINILFLIINTRYY